jgi:hypothetical protein
LDSIDDKDVFVAVMSSLQMIREGIAPWEASSAAARYYSVDVSTVSHYVSQAAGTIGGRRKNGVRR